MGLKKAAITTQCAWRGRVARRELRKLKMVRIGENVLTIFSLFALLLQYYLIHSAIRDQLSTM
jgi:hypothetical protein